MAASSTLKQPAEIGAPYKHCQTIAQHCEIKLHGPLSRVFKHIRRRKCVLFIGNHKKIHATVEEFYQLLTKRLYYNVTISSSSYILRRNTRTLTKMSQRTTKQKHHISTEKPPTFAATVNYSTGFNLANIQIPYLDSQIIRYNNDFCFDIETQNCAYIGQSPTMGLSSIDNRNSKFKSTLGQFDITKSMDGINIEPLSLNEKSDEYMTGETGLKTLYVDPGERERYYHGQVQSLDTTVSKPNTEDVSLETNLAEYSGTQTGSHKIIKHTKTTETETPVGNNKLCMGNQVSAQECTFTEEPPSSSSANPDLFDAPDFLMDFHPLHGLLDVQNDEKYDRSDKLCDELEPHLARINEVNSTGIDSITCNFQIFVDPGTEDYVWSRLRRLHLENPEDFELIEVIEDDAEVSWLAQAVEDKQEKEHPAKDKVDVTYTDMQVEEYDISSGQTANTESLSQSSEMPVFMDCFLAGSVKKIEKQCFLAGPVDKNGKPCPVSVRPGQAIYPIEAKNAGQIRNDPEPLMHTLGCIMIGERDRCWYGLTVGHSKNLKEWIYYTKCSGGATTPIIGKCCEQLYGKFGGSTIDVCALKLHKDLHPFIDSSVSFPNPFREARIVRCFDGPPKALKNVQVFMLGARSGFQAGKVVITKYKTEDPEGKEVRNAIVVKIKADKGDSGTLLLANPRPGAEGKLEVDAVAQIMINRKGRSEVICCPFYITKQYVEQSIGQKLHFR